MARNDRVHDVLTEALRREVPGRPLVATAASDDSLGSGDLGLEPRHGVLDDVALDAGSGELVTHESVTGATVGERRRARSGEASIVREAGANEGRERIGTLVLREASLHEVAVELCEAAIAMAQRTERRLDGLRLRAGRGLSSRREPPRRSRPRPTPPWAPATGGAGPR